MIAEHKKIELLAPAGNFEKLEIAVHYGADAVYLGDKEFSLRNFSGNFTADEIGDAVAFAHQNGVKIYVACNIYPRNFEIDAISAYFTRLGAIQPDAVIISDPGIFMLAKQTIPHIPVHLSTQVNTTSYQSVLFWENMGVKRVNVARELPLDEIAEIARRTSVEIEVFVHGAMCISYSGRCLLSSFLTKRDSNRGMCSHPCRWNYSVVEELRPGEYMPIAEDKRGAYIFNSRDLCMIDHIPSLAAAGVTSFKIEGRMKTINYVASTVKAYREAVDAYNADPEGFQPQAEWIRQLTSISHRDYCTGFYFNEPDQVLPNYSTDAPMAGNLFVGKVISGSGDKKVQVEMKNKVFSGDDIEILSPKGPIRHDTIERILDKDERPVPFAQPGSTVTFVLNQNCSRNDLIRKTHVDLTKTGEKI